MQIPCFSIKIQSPVCALRVQVALPNRKQSLHIIYWTTIVMKPWCSHTILPWFRNMFLTFNIIIQFSSVAQSCPTLCGPVNPACQACLSITSSRSSLKLMSIELVMPSSHLILCRPLLLLPPVPPASESFPMSQLFTWGGQNTGVSAFVSFLPKNTQGWSPLQWTGWISLQSRGNSRVFSNNTVQKHQFFGA